MLQFVLRCVPYLNENFLRAQLEFYSQFYGYTELAPRWLHCIKTVNSDMYVAMNAIYVENFFGGSTATEIEQMLTELQATIVEMLRESQNDTVVDKVLDKFAEMQMEIGHSPDFGDPAFVAGFYEDLELVDGNFMRSMMRVLENGRRQDWKVLGRPLADTVWYHKLKAFDVEAYYIIYLNRIVIPAGILQAPFYNRAYGHLNLAAIGMMMAHELGHAYDKYVDAPDNFTECMRDQYDAYKFAEVEQTVDGTSTYRKYL